MRPQPDGAQPNAESFEARLLYVQRISSKNSRMDCTTPGRSAVSLEVNLRRTFRHLGHLQQNFRCSAAGVRARPKKIRSKPLKFRDSVSEKQVITRQVGWPDSGIGGRG